MVEIQDMIADLEQRKLDFVAAADSAIATLQQLNGITLAVAQPSGARKASTPKSTARKYSTKKSAPARNASTTAESQQRKAMTPAVRKKIAETQKRLHRERMAARELTGAAKSTTKKPASQTARKSALPKKKSTAS
jgi:hypothetical protein